VTITYTLGSSAQLAALYQAVTTPHPVGPGTSLGDKITQAETYENAGYETDTCTTLGLFISEVKAQTRKSISAATATTLTRLARQIQGELGC
jgi:hypothetical protein